MIYLNGQQIENIAGFSMRFQVVLSMIQGGTEWLIRALKEQPFPVNVTSEEQLLALIQEGLHEDDYIRFNTFRTTLSKILTLSDADADQLAVVRKSANDNETNLKVLMQYNNILGYADMNQVAGFITAMSTGRPDLFQAPCFEDMIALTTFLKTQQGADTSINNPAYAFALGIAATIPDFVNLSLFYQEVLQQLPDNLTPLVQASKIQVIYNQLLPTAFYLLFTPNAGKVRNEGTLRKVIPELARANKFIGYATTAEIVLNLAQNINLYDQPDKTLQSLIDSYLAAAKNIVSFTPASAYSLSQDGRVAILRFKKDQEQVLTGVDGHGNLFLLPGTTINSN